ncbi:hypothetical protein PanWU01x14_250010 [Parasponia andersonii]|uniref:Uncharacterized protein n=1 Tax=Parasponia andersonii TaxID=3476 RepID=A0A2P5BD41_PARAD|nr:hypothetical protein PanWU01x14_250010 [Parasponia andersonii]
MRNSISSLPTIPLSSSTFTLTPTFHKSSTSLASVGWSVHCGIPTIGTAKLRASIVEFHPQCVKKHPIAGCDRISTWGPHFTINPFSPASFANLGGSFASSVSLTTHKKLKLVALNPNASSSICLTLKLAMLPKETNTTDPLGLLLSQLLMVTEV